jgi:hypothetical protein
MRGVDGIIDQIGKFVGETFGLILFDARQKPSPGIKPQPCIEQVALLDQFDDRGLALWKSKSETKSEAKVAIPCQCKRWIIGLARELSMKTRNCIETGLMAAFHPQDV